ncbi:MAG: GAF domain-containing protein [Elusimicrobia bacterium]|nr:GAF domain-containing protein [Elusimicrobiota bacterium]
MTGQDAKSAPGLGIDATSLFEIAEEITSSTDLDTVLNKIGLVAKKLLNCEASSIMLFDESRKSLYFKVATGEKGTAIKRFVVPVGVGVAGWVGQNLQPVIIKDTSKDPRFTGQFDKSSGFITRSLICVPMFSKGEPIGIMEVLNKTEGKFDDSDMALLTHLAGLASIAITNARLVQDQRNFYAHMLEVLALAIESLGPRFIGLPWRSQRMAATLGRLLGLGAKDLTNLSYASLLHDIGYLAQNNSRYIELLGIAAPPVVSNRENKEGFHAVLGEQMLSGIDLFKGALPLIRHHHENFDGTGYPDRLAAGAIPLGARVIALLVVVEDVRYQLRGASAQDLRAQIKAEVTNFSQWRLDPDIVKVFLEALEHEELI